MVAPNFDQGAEIVAFPQQREGLGRVWDLLELLDALAVGGVWTGRQEELQQQLGASESTVRRLLRRAEALGYMARPAGRGVALTYTLVAAPARAEVVAACITPIREGIETPVNPGHATPVNPGQPRSNGDRGPLATPVTQVQGSRAGEPFSSSSSSSDPGHTTPVMTTRTSAPSSVAAPAVTGTPTNPGHADLDPGHGNGDGPGGGLVLTAAGEIRRRFGVVADADLAATWEGMSVEARRQAVMLASDWPSRYDVPPATWLAKVFDTAIAAASPLPDVPMLPLSGAAIPASDVDEDWGAAPAAVTVEEVADSTAHLARPPRPPRQYAWMRPSRPRGPTWAEVELDAMRVEWGAARNGSARRERD